MAAVDLSLSGLASGFDWKTLVDQLAEAERSPQTQLRTEQDTLDRRNNAYGSIKTELGVLQTRIDALKDPTLYDSRNSSVADSTVANSTVANGAATGTYTFNITQLATAAKRTGASNVGSQLSATTNVSAVKLSSAAFASTITAGTFSVNGKQVAVETTDSLQDVFDKIAVATNHTVAGSYVPGTDKITLTSASEVVLGSATDTSNFLSVAKLYNNGTGTVSSTNALGGVSLSSTLGSANFTTPISDGGSGAGEFKINGVSISFSATNDSVANVISRINSSAAGVTATYDSVNDRFVLANKGTGDMDIALENVTGNFLTATGMTTSTLSHGKNLLYNINGGDQLVSSSNTITDASSGLTGLSVTALKLGTTAVSVASDTTKIKNAITSFVDSYNQVQSLIDTQTASSTDAKGVVTAGILANDNDADDIASTLRSAVFSQINGLAGSLKHLASLGIQTSGDNNKLKLSDTTQLDTALNNSLADVKDLFSNSTMGIATSLSAFLDRTIGEKGTLIAKQDGLTKQSRAIDTQVVDMEKIVQADRTRMLAAFTAMETAQQKSNQQLQYLTKQFGS